MLQIFLSFLVEDCLLGLGEYFIRIAAEEKIVSKASNNAIVLDGLGYLFILVFVVAFGRSFKFSLVLKTLVEYHFSYLIMNN